MKESVLKDFFSGKLTATELKRDLVGAVRKTSRDVYTQTVVAMESDFKVSNDCIVRLCEAVLSGDLAPSELEPIAFCLLGSDKFIFDEKLPETDRLLEVLHDWSSPEINYALTTQTVAKFKNLLITGQNTFTSEDLTKQTNA